MKRILMFFVFILVLGVVFAFAADYDAQFDSQQNIPTTMTVGKKYSLISLTFKNTGTNPWIPGQVRLGSQNPQDNLFWGFGRVDLKRQVPSGDYYTFTFTVTAPYCPNPPGNYHFQWQMLKEGVTWFGDKSTDVVVRVIQPSFEANYISGSVPKTMYAHKPYDVSLTFKNTGESTWLQAINVRLGSQTPQDNMIWGLGRVYLNATDSIATCQSKTFNFTVTSPIDPGVYNFQWQMLKENVKWFGDKSTNVKVNVVKAVDITNPTDEQNVSGTVPVSVSFIINPVHADFYVDGVLLTSVDSPISNPYTFLWDSTVNHVPAPTHPIDYGYYGVVGIQGDDNHEVDFSAEVNCYTNSYIGGRAAYKLVSNWATLLDGDLALAVSQGRRIELILDMQNPDYMNSSYLDQVFDVAAPYWDHIVRIEIAGEPLWNRTTTESRIQDAQNALIEHGLSDRPMGIMLQINNPHYDEVVNATGLDWVGIEAYVDSPGNDFSQDNIDKLDFIVTQAINKVPVGKDIILAQMAFRRDGSWTNLDTLRDLQIPTYLLAYNNPRVIAIRMFVYSKPNGNLGTKENPVLKTPHILVGEKILNVSNPYSGQGRRTLMVMAYDEFGEVYIDTVIVNVGSVPPTNPCE